MRNVEALFVRVTDERGSTRGQRSVQCHQHIHHGIIRSIVQLEIQQLEFVHWTLWNW